MPKSDTRYPCEKESGGHRKTTSLRALHDHRRILLLYQANDVRVDEVALAQLSQLPEVRNFLTLFQWSSSVDSHENYKR